MIWVRNILLIVALGICSSRYPGKGKKIGISSLFLRAATGVFFVQEIGDMTSVLFLIVFSILCSAPSVVQALDTEVPDED